METFGPGGGIGGDGIDLGRGLWCVVAADLSFARLSLMLIVL